MKHRHMIALAGAATIIAAPSAFATPTVSMVFDFDPYVVGFNLMSATITITGFSAGNRIQGFKGTAANPWVVRTGNGRPFFNIPTVENPTSPSSPIFTDGFYAAPSNNSTLNAMSPYARWDSGLLGSLNAQPGFSLGSPADSDPTDDVGGFAMFAAGGNSDINIDPMAWITIAPGGIPVNENSNFRVMRLTWPANTSVRVDFVLVMNTPAVDIPFSIQTPLEPFGACCLPKGECTYTTAAGCFNLGGTFGSYQLCEITCAIVLPPCPADIAPPGPPQGDDVVNVADLLAVIGAWGACASPPPIDCPADIAPPGSPAGDDVVNVQDLLAVIDAWGACPSQ